MQEAFKAWIHDFILYAKTEVDLLKSLDKFMKICRKHNLILSAKKCVFFKEETRWYGRIIDSEGYRMDPQNIEAIRNRSFQITADELCQFIHCCRWMSTCIPDFHRKSEPLMSILEAAYKLAGKRK